MGYGPTIFHKKHVAEIKAPSHVLLYKKIIKSRTLLFCYRAVA